MDAKTILTRIEVGLGLEHPGLTTLYGGKLKWEGKPLVTSNGGWSIQVKSVECFPRECESGRFIEQVGVVGYTFGKEVEDHKVVLLPVTRGRIFDTLADYEKVKHNPQVIMGKEELTELVDQSFAGKDLKAYLDKQIYRGPGKPTK